MGSSFNSFNASGFNAGLASGFNARGDVAESLLLISAAYLKSGETGVALVSTGLHGIQQRTDALFGFDLPGPYTNPIAGMSYHKASGDIYLAIRGQVGLYGSVTRFNFNGRNWGSHTHITETVISSPGDGVVGLGVTDSGSVRTSSYFVRNPFQNPMPSDYRYSLYGFSPAGVQQWKRVYSWYQDQPHVWWFYHFAPPQISFIPGTETGFGASPAFAVEEFPVSAPILYHVGCFDSSGAFVWTRQLPTLPGASGFIAGYGCAYGGGGTPVLYVAAGVPAFPSDEATPSLYGMDPSSGSIVWSHTSQLHGSDWVMWKRVKLDPRNGNAIFFGNYHPIIGLNAGRYELDLIDLSGCIMVCAPDGTVLATHRVDHFAISDGTMDRRGHFYLVSERQHGYYPPAEVDVVNLVHLDEAGVFVKGMNTYDPNDAEPLPYLRLIELYEPDG